MGFVGKIKTLSKVLPLDTPMFIAGRPKVSALLLSLSTITSRYSSRYSTTRLCDMQNMPSCPVSPTPDDLVLVSVR